MPLITKMTKGKNNEYYKLEIDGEETLSIHMEVALLHRIKEGSRIELEELKGIILEDQKKRAYNHSLHFLSYRPRTQWEVEEYLRKKGYAQNVIQYGMEKLVYYKMIDDYAYMKAYIEEKKGGPPAGRAKMRYDLSRKGIGEELLSYLDDWYSREDEIQQAGKLAEKLSSKYTRLPPKERVKKISQAGRRRGFSWEIMSRVVQDLVLSLEEEEDVGAPAVDLEKALQWGWKYKKRYQKKGLQGIPLKQKIIHALMGRGYPWEAIEEILPDIIGRTDDEA